MSAKKKQDLSFLPEELRTKPKAEQIAYCLDSLYAAEKHVVTAERLRNEFLHRLAAVITDVDLDATCKKHLPALPRLKA